MKDIQNKHNTKNSSQMPRQDKKSNTQTTYQLINQHGNTCTPAKTSQWTTHSIKQTKHELKQNSKRATKKQNKSPNNKTQMQTSMQTLANMLFHSPCQPETLKQLIRRFDPPLIAELKFCTSPGTLIFNNHGAAIALRFLVFLQ